VQDPGSAHYESVFTQLRVLCAIRLDCHTPLMAAEIGDEAFDCARALKAKAKVAAAQVKICFLFSAGWVLAHCSVLTSTETVDQAAVIDKAWAHIAACTPILTFPHGLNGGRERATAHGITVPRGTFLPISDATSPLWEIADQRYVRHVAQM
jgi:hypothetical protein